MRCLIVVLLCGATMGFAHNSYTGGYSGAPGRQRCASSCHGGTAGTIVVSGFPSSYQPRQTYTITVVHNGGSRIVNFNATTRVGATTTVAGTFATVANTALYTGADGGVYANPHAIDTAVFRWTAPAPGTGAVNFYCAGFQGTTSSPNGQSTFINLSASEITTDISSPQSVPTGFVLKQNYPNPFSTQSAWSQGQHGSSSTTIEYIIPASGHVSLEVYSPLGELVAVLERGEMSAGIHRTVFRPQGLASGVYFYRLSVGSLIETRRMILSR